MTHVEVAIVGAGFAGLAMAIALRQAGRESFAILERGDSVGGTWRDNTYPGIACDVPSHLYGFATHPNPDWAGEFATGAELRDYLERVASHERLGDRLRLGTPMLSARWEEAGSRWLLETGGAEPGILTADVLVLACGRLTEPRIPAFPGLETFPGAIFHTARWDHGTALDGRHVAVVGSGASAIQVVPELARRAGHVTLLQRSPAWIMPRGGRAYTAEERRRFADHPEELAARRAELYAEGEARFASRSGDPAASAAASAIARAHLEAQVPDAALRAALTPDYAFGCKRVLLSDDFYPAVSSDAVTLVTSALARIEGDTLIAADGSRHSVDVLVLATGFLTRRQPYATLVTGEDGLTLAEHWADGMTSFASTVVPGFPSMFVLDGPNAALGHNSSVLMLEEQAAYAVRALAGRAAFPGGALRPRAESEQQYTDEIARAAASTPWLTGGCRSWYVDRGRLTLLWPGTVDAFRARLARADGSEFETAPARTGDERSQG